MNTQDAVLISRTVTTLRAIVLSLAAGIAVFATVVLILRSQGFDGDGNLRIVTYVGLAVLVGNVATGAAVFPVMEQAARRRNDATSGGAGPWLNLYTMRTIVGCAMLEGAAFLCLIGALLDGEPLGLIAGLSAAALMIGLFLPTEDHVRAFVDRQAELANAERMGV